MPPAWNSHPSDDDPGADITESNSNLQGLYSYINEQNLASAAKYNEHPACEGE